MVPEARKHLPFHRVKPIVDSNMAGAGVIRGEATMPLTPISWVSEILRITARMYGSQKD